MCTRLVSADTKRAKCFTHIKRLQNLRSKQSRRACLTRYKVRAACDLSLFVRHQSRAPKLRDPWAAVATGRIELVQSCVTQEQRLTDDDKGQCSGY